MIKEYWNLTGYNFILELETFFGYNLRTKFFSSMQFLQNVNEP